MVKLIRTLTPILTLILFMIAVGDSVATEKVVVVPLGGNDNNGQYVSAENSYIWNNSSRVVMSLGVRANCPNDCIAVNGACSEKTVGDVSGVTITGENFSKSNAQKPYFDEYTCWMWAAHDPTAPPVGYAQVICHCQ